MSQLEEYYANHSRAFRFPWSIYHNPLLEDLLGAINEVAEQKTAPKVLVIGPGDFYEFNALKEKNFEIHILDIDPRVIEDTLDKFPSQIRSSYLVGEDFAGYPEEKFDLIYAKEVIEHIPDTNSFLRKIFSLCHLKTLVWMSTPNYGDWTLPLVEKTFLELVARLSGFTRKGIHPKPFGQRELEQAFIENGFQVNKCLKSPFKFALTLWATIASENKE